MTFGRAARWRLVRVSPSATPESRLVRPPKERKPDISKAKATLGWEPKTQLREGLVKTIAHFEKLLSEGTAPAIGGAARQLT
jgi:nucleoside-diphosphate-sugar epimerase